MHLTHIYDYMFTYTVTKSNLPMMLLAMCTGMPRPIHGQLVMYVSKHTLSECIF